MRAPSRERLAMFLNPVAGRVGQSGAGQEGRAGMLFHRAEWTRPFCPEDGNGSDIEGKFQ